jgi:putative DNA primase/helicase
MSAPEGEPLSAAELAAIAARHPLDEVAARRVRLRRLRGVTLGPCPLCSSEPASLTASELECDAKTFRCTLCGAAGDVLDLVAAMHDLDRQGAARFLEASSELGAAPGEPVAAGEGGAFDLKLAFFPQTDLGNAERFRERNRDRFRFCPVIGWLAWDGKRWAREGAQERLRMAQHETVRAIQAEAAALAKSGRDFSVDKETMMSDRLAAWGRRSEASARITQIEHNAAPYLYVPPEALDADPWKINVRNGTLQVVRGGAGEAVRFREHDPTDLITRLIEVDYEPAATCPAYDDFLAYVQPQGRVRRFLHQWGGLSLTGDISEQKLVFFWGKGKNGKSTLVGAWCHVAGDYSRTVPIETFVAEGRSRNAGQATPDLAMLQGRRMVVASEPDRGAKLSEALIKLITGGDVMPVRHLNREYFDLHPQFKLVMSGNYRPRIEGADEGIWRRVTLVPWTVTVPEEKRDRALLDKLKGEAAGILNRLLDGLRDWLDHGLLAPEEVVKATAEYRRDSDPLGRFLEACVAAAPGERVQASEMHALFIAWARASSASEWSPKGLAGALKERGFESQHSNVNWWLNVKLVQQVDDFVDHDGKPRRQKPVREGEKEGEDAEPVF